MSCLWGRITSKKGTEIEKIKKILLNIEPDYKNYSSDEFKKIEFDTHYKLEDNEIFYLELIEDVRNLIKNQDILKLSDENSTGDTQLIKKEWKNLDYLIYFKDSNLYYQRIVGKKYLTRKKILIFDTETPVLEEKSEGILINENPDVVYNKGENKIYFKSFTSLNKIFKGINSLYREASKEEVNNFLNSDLIQSADINLEDITIAKRKKIAQAVDKLDSFTSDQKIELTTYGKKYHSGIYENNKINVTDNHNLDLALKIVFEHFYTTEVTKVQSEANSVREI